MVLKRPDFIPIFDEEIAINNEENKAGKQFHGG